MRIIGELFKITEKIRFRASIHSFVRGRQCIVKMGGGYWLGFLGGVPVRIGKTACIVNIHTIYLL